MTQHQYAKATRQDSNLEICRILTEYFSRPENADQRFFQGLMNQGLLRQQVDDRLNVTGVDDPFYDESLSTLTRLQG